MARWGVWVLIAVQVVGLGLWLLGGPGEEAQQAQGGAIEGGAGGEAQGVVGGEGLGEGLGEGVEVAAPEEVEREVSGGLVGARLELGQVKRALAEVEAAAAVEAAATEAEAQAVSGQVGAQRDALLDAWVEVSVRGGRYPFQWRALGGEIVSASDEGALRRMVEAGYVMREGELEGERVVFGLKGARARAAVGGLAGVWERAALDARWDFVQKKFIPHRVGFALDVEAGVEALLEGFMQRAEEVDVAVREVYPAPRIDQEPLASWRPDVQMGVFRTKYDPKKRDRSHNLKLAADALDGVIMMPGQTFSYNAVVGERTLTRGYREAPVIVYGEMLEGVGGGACQISSTMYALSLLSGLDIIERANHSLPSSYIEKGLDAVVSWPHLDLKVRNSYPFPIAVRAGLTENQVVISLWGSQPAKRVLIRREVTEKLPFVERVEVSDEMNPKQVRKVREGHFGYRISKGRITWDDTGEQFERMIEDVYISRPRQIKIGPDTLYPESDSGRAASAGDDDALSVED
jgi:vancomycin resistance protein YoaR